MKELEKINRELQKITEELYCQYYETCYRDDFLIEKLNKSINEGLQQVGVVRMTCKAFY